ncbi:MFS transporter [Amycolatopsis granulosa]|uniref:MFS transporter n=1 Tax=Amycolatopsis granulosa TaxID=185684 RepID=UPI001421C0F7|nr:MFS transporter [Amycolatopsis granulosa]NIH87141.1 putative MFS transporter [Amycolatopsis granulosa]
MAGHDAQSFIDRAPLTRFHLKLTLFSAGGPLLDGYAVTIIGLALLTLAPALHLDATQTGLTAAAALAGILVGGLVFGRLTDRIGRKVMYIANLVALSAVSILCAFVVDAWQLIALRFVLGIMIGADYPIASSLLAEFVPSRHRGRLLGALFAAFGVGAALAAGAGWALSALGPDAWRWMLASPAVIGVVTLVLRLNAPESPRWLLNHGRRDEAERVVRKIWGPDARVDELREPESAPSTALLNRRSVRRMAFVSAFFIAHVVPLFAVYSFGPTLLHRLGIGTDSPYLPEVIIALLFVVGSVPGLWLVDRIGRIPLLVGTFAIMVVVFAFIALAPAAPPGLLFAALALFAIASGASNFIEIIVPNELFPTSVRATATGIVVAVSRIGAAISTFLLPTVLAGLGTSAVMWFLAAVNAAGLLGTVVLGEETMGRPLSALPAGARLPGRGGRG